MMSFFKIDSVTDTTGLWTFVGIQNYEKLFATAIFRKSMLNLFKIWAIGGAIVLSVSLLFGVILTSGIRGKKFFRAVIYLPNLVSAVALATMWFKLVVQREMQGECFLVNFADDFVAGFQYKSEAERYYKELKERMEKFGLELESSKSRLIEFGRFAEQNRRARGECKPETFDFLGFTFYCSKTRKGGFVPKVQTSRKKFEQKVRAYKNWIYDNRNRPMREIIKELNVKLIGHYRYYGVTWNFRKITTFLHRVQQFRFKAMNRRGCRRAYTWNRFVEMLKYYPLAKPKTYYCLY